MERGGNSATLTEVSSVIMKLRLKYSRQLSYSRYRQYREGGREREMVRMRQVEGGGEVGLMYVFRVSYF